jgi:hypothetical protein
MKILGGLVVAVLVVGMIYGSYWVTKNVSYWLFYEDMVVQTITEKVDGKCLIAD